MVYLHLLTLFATLMVLAGVAPRPSAAADPIIVIEHFTNFR